MYGVCKQYGIMPLLLRIYKFVKNLFVHKAYLPIGFSSKMLPACFYK